ncbi:MAG: hypothetical protein K0V04_38630 [Deltaproteobacteria bacterium]|nr:hypothetical protein [Deltaproteobacteria bacterium]
MPLSSLFRLLTSSCLLLLWTLTGCKGSAPTSSPSGYPSGGGFSAPAAPDHMGTQADTRSRRSVNHARANEPAPSPEPSAGVYDGDYAESEAYRRDDSRTAQAPAEHRPGLGTSYGEHHHSRVTTAPFVRGTSQPDVLLSLWYNDPEGVRLAQGSYGRGYDRDAQASTSDGAFVVTVVDEYGYDLPAAQVADKRYVVGEPGQRYKLRVHNNSAYRYEVVASVDGLDVIDGEPASFGKRGYILDPWSAITIDGWRTSEQAVAAFRFSAMEDSYAGRTGQARNIGVVGFAFFHERGGVPWHELNRRDSADPFPHRYAEPPPPRRWR